MTWSGTIDYMRTLKASLVLGMSRRLERSQAFLTTTVGLSLRQSDHACVACAAACHCRPLMTPMTVRACKTLARIVASPIPSAKFDCQTRLVARLGGRRGWRGRGRGGSAGTLRRRG